MPYNGSGTFNPLPPPTYPAVGGTVIRADYFNSIITDLMSGLSNAVTRDGQSPPSVDLPMGGKKLVNMAAGSAGTDSATVGNVSAMIASYAADPANTRVAKRNGTNWATTPDAVGTFIVGGLAWQKFGNNHAIFDISAGSVPGTGNSVSDTNPASNWVPGYPCLMGWNGVNTHGVRVDSCRLADTANTASTADDAIGNGQVWQNPTRSVGVLYTNSTGRSIMVNIAYFSNGALVSTSYFYVDGVIAAVATAAASGTSTANVSFIVQPGEQYYMQHMVGSPPLLVLWSELRT